MENRLLICRREDGSLSVYQWDGKGLASHAVAVVRGMPRSSRLSRPGDFNGDGHDDLAARGRSERPARSRPTGEASSKPAADLLGAGSRSGAPVRSRPGRRPRPDRVERDRGRDPREPARRHVRALRPEALGDAQPIRAAPASEAPEESARSARPTSTATAIRTSSSRAKEASSSGATIASCGSRTRLRARASAVRSGHGGSRRRRRRRSDARHPGFNPATVFRRRRSFRLTFSRPRSKAS